VADEQARVTHLDPRSRAAAILVADVVALALRDNWQGGRAGLAWLASRVDAQDPSQADTSRHSKLNRKSGYHLPHETRSTPAT
jgi:ADP-ribosylglycohydrolase